MKLSKLMATDRVAGCLSLNVLKVTVLICLATMVSVPALAASQVPSLPKVIGSVAVTSDSQIYFAENVPGATASIDLKSNDYVEEEFFLSGSANIYRYDAEWNRQLQQADVPYTTRMVVRRPRDPAKFSGNVQFECAHPSLGNTSHWNAVKRYVVRHEDVFVIVMCGADPLQRKSANTAAPTAAHDILKWFDPKRYASINWPEDDGVRWDVIAQAGALLKSKVASNPLAGYKVEHTYAAGWSFTGSLWRTYVNEGFHDQYHMPDGRPIFDGYLLGISSSTSGGGYVPLSNDYNLPVGNPRRTTKSIDVPVIELLSENEAVTNLGPQAPESDDPKSRHRLYEVPARTHSSGPLPGITANRVQLSARGYPSEETVQYVAGCEPQGSDVPMGGIAIAAIDNIDAWVRHGIPPPHAARMKLDPETKKGLKDAHGNTLGGARSAQLDVPLAKYGDYVEPSCAAQSAPSGYRSTPAPGRFMPMWRVALSKEEVHTLYKNEADYLKKFKARLDQMVKERWLLKPEADEQFEAAKANAKAAFAGS